MARVALFIALLLSNAPLAAAQEPPGRPEGPGRGAYEVAISGQFGRFFSAEVTGFDLGLGLGYFVSDNVELLVNAGVAYTSNGAKASDSASGTLSGPVTVAAIPAVASEGGWTTSLTLGARWFLPGRGPLPAAFAPFVGLEAGGLMAEDVDPFVVGSAVVGARLPIGARAAFTPQAGYVFIHATDSNVRFGDSRTEHGVAAFWSLSVFF